MRTSAGNAGAFTGSFHFSIARFHAEARIVRLPRRDRVTGSHRVTRFNRVTWGDSVTRSHRVTRFNGISRRDRVTGSHGFAWRHSLARSDRFARRDRIARGDRDGWAGLVAKQPTRQGWQQPVAGSRQSWRSPRRDAGRRQSS
jgi:hypothetical protein